MLCSVCKEKEATVHLTLIVGDKMQKHDFCTDCAKNRGVTDPQGFSLAALLEQMRKTPGPENRLQ